MRELRHTINCTVPTLEALQITVNLGLTDEQIAHGQVRGIYRFILDFPNWDEVAEALCFFELDPETGEDTTTPMSKPAMPLTSKGMTRLPGVLQQYLYGGYAIVDANTDFLRTTRPK